MVALVQSKVVVGGPIIPDTAPTPGNLMVLLCATRSTGAGPATIGGWEPHPAGVLATPTGTARDHMMFWRPAQPGDSSWLTGGSYTGTVFTFAELSGATAVVEDTGTASNPTAGTNTAGGPVTTSDSALIVGGMAASLVNDTQTMSTAPDAGVTEISDKGGASGAPGYWTAYRVEASPGTYELTGVITASGTGFVAGIIGHVVAFLVAAPPVADFTADVTSIEEGATVTFTDLSTNNPTSWAWTFGDGGTSTSQDPTHVYTSAGTYSVSLTATNADGSDTETKLTYILVVIAGTPEPPRPSGVLLEIYAASPGSARWDNANWDEAVWSQAGWQDVTPQGISVDITWGSRQPELGILSKPEAADWQVSFYDPLRLLDPANADSPYYTDLIPFLPIRVSHRSTIVRVGYATGISRRYAKSTETGFIRATDNVSRLANAQVPSDTTLSDTLYARAADAIAAAGLQVTVLAPITTDPSLDPWITGVNDWSAWQWITDAADQVNYIPIVDRLGNLTFRPWAAPLTRGRSLNSPELVDLQNVADYIGQYSVIQASDDGSTFIERALTPPPRYGARTYKRTDPTINPATWAEAVLADRALPGLRWVPGTVFPLTANSTEAFALLEAVELVTMALPEQEPPVSATAILVGGHVHVHGKRDDEAVWRFNFEAAQTAIEPLIEDGGGPTDYLLSEGGDEFIYPDT